MLEVNIMRSARGFTLIEMLVTLSILGIMLGIGVPSFKSFAASQRVKTAAYDLTTSLMIARSEAVKRNTDVGLTPVSPTAWASGWTVASSTATVQEQQSYVGVTITPKDTATPATAISLSGLTFSKSGRLAAKAYFEIVGLSGTKCVKVDQSGIPSSSAGACS